ncbi:hypothetical protein EV702DRAFT_1074457 [Suillus placidus]|uniref:Uncharacterized protein n=1 Tax=Suillus placidus TaxID=48579 RepID=A0A9P7A2A9_9AGAM|nr:hypothetical protein EV702DRAFT_1074457 [Suillus placidus]
MKLSALFFVVASACTVLAAPILVGSGLEARSPLEEAREVCDLHSSSVCVHLPHRPKADELSRLEAGCTDGWNSRLETGCPDGWISRLVNPRYHSDERNGPSTHPPNSSLVFCFSWIQFILYSLTQTHLEVSVLLCSTINRSGHLRHLQKRAS